MDFSQPYDEKDPKRFTLADYDGESNDDSRPPLPRNPSSSSMTSANAQRKPSLRRKPAPQAGGLALHNPDAYGSSSRPRADPTSPSALSSSSSRSARTQPTLDVPSLARSFNSAPSFADRDPEQYPAQASTLPSSRSYGAHSPYHTQGGQSNPSAPISYASQSPRSPGKGPYGQPDFASAQPYGQTEYGGRGLLPASLHEAYRQPLPSSASYASSQPLTPTIPMNDSHPLELLPSIPRSYSSGHIQYPPDPHRPDVSDAGSMRYPAEKDGPPPISKKTSSRPATPWYKTIIPHTIPCRLFLATVITELVINLAIEANILWRFNVEVKSIDSTELELENKRRLPVYLVIYGLAYLWELVLTVIAIRARNTVQIVAITSFNFAILGYAVIQIFELRRILGDNLKDSLSTDDSDLGSAPTLLSLPLNVLTAVVIAVVAAGCVAMVVLSYFIRRDFGWDRYRFLGADLQIRRFYRRFQIFECIAYFSAFFCAGFGIQFIWLVLQKTDVEYIITWIAFPLSILLLIMGRFAAKYENKWLMAPFEFGLAAGCAYFIYKLIRIWQQSTTTYQNVTISLTTFDALSVLSLGACFVGGVIVWCNFGKGLKQALTTQPQITSAPSLSRFGRAKCSEAEGEAIDMSSHRISII